MPINRAPFNALVDDNGTGLTGSIWNKAAIQGVLLDPIDALAAGLPVVYGTWTPADLSGGNLTLTNNGCRYATLGKLVFLWGHVQYPTTSDSRPAIIGGFPYANSAQYGGLYHTYGLATAYQIPANQAYTILLHPTTMGNHTNATLSAATLIFNGLYLLP